MTDPVRGRDGVTGRLTSVMSPFQRFTRKINTTGICWEWTGGEKGYGYGVFRVNGRSVAAHRASYEFFVGPIPPGLVIDHLCRNRKCVRPEHLEPVTNRENIIRGITGPAKNVLKTHCMHGHPLSGENAYVTMYDGRRRRACKACWTIRRKKREAALKANNPGRRP